MPLVPTEDLALLDQLVTAARQARQRGRERGHSREEIDDHLTALFVLPPADEMTVAGLARHVGYMASTMVLMLNRLIDLEDRGR